MTGGREFAVHHDGFSLGTVEILYAYVVSVELTPKQLGAPRSIFGGLNSRQLNQMNNIHITYYAKGHELVLRLEMFGSATLMGAANLSRKLMDLLRTEGIVEKFKGHAAAAPSSRSDPLAQIAKLAELTAQGVLTREEFEAKKAELLARMQPAGHPGKGVPQCKLELIRRLARM